MQNEKPVVLYHPNPLQQINVGGEALIFGVVNHPAGLRGEVVRTSRVRRLERDLAACPLAVEFETENTWYRPITEDISATENERPSS